MTSDHESLLELPSVYGRASSGLTRHTLYTQHASQRNTNAETKSKHEAIGILAEPHVGASKCLKFAQDGREKREQVSWYACMRGIGLWGSWLEKFRDVTR
jgi:hypothetical protein